MLKNERIICTVKKTITSLKGISDSRVKIELILERKKKGTLLSYVSSERGINIGHTQPHVSATVKPGSREVC